MLLLSYDMDTVLGHCQIRGKGQITIPPKVRARLSLAEGDVVAFFLDEDGVLMVKAKLTVIRPK